MPFFLLFPWILLVLSLPFTQCFISYEPLNMQDLNDDRGILFTGTSSYYTSSTSQFVVAGGGDFNQDGVDDVVIGIPSQNAIQIVFGSKVQMSNQDLPIADNTISIKITGDASSLFGTSVAFAGDINGDLKADILVGAPDGSSGLGAVYVIFGTNSPSDAYVGDLVSSYQACVITGQTSGGNTGFSVSSGGDIDVDGVPDILIGAPNENTNTGVAYLIYGGFINAQIAAATPSISLGGAFNGLKMIGENSGDSFGYSVAYIGDLNNDGYGDIAIGAPNAPISSVAGATKSGAVYLIYGGAGNAYPVWGSISFTLPLPSYVTKILGENGQYKFGASISGAGHVNNDDYADIIIGAPAANSNYGAAYVLYGTNAWTTTVIVDGLSYSGFKLAGENSGDYYGTVVAEIGDVNGDGLDDMAIGVPNYDSNKGKVYVVFGKSMTGTAGMNLGYNTGYQLEGNETSGYFGISVSNAGDFNGNNRPDVVIGTQLTRAYVVFDQRCPRTCSDCGSIFVCYSCFVNYCLLGGYCVTCPDGYYYDSSLTNCQQCPSGCTKCVSLTECLECTSGQYLYNFQCGACPVSTYISGLECLDCPGTCLTCTDSTTCQTCQLGYGISGTGCITCPSSTNLTNGYCIAEIHHVASASSSTTLTNLSSAAFQISSLLSSGMSVGSSMSIKLNLISKIVQNIRYLNISYSSKLLDIFQTWDTDVIAINPPGSLQNDIPSKSLPYVFARYDLEPSFLPNFWLSLIMILGSLVISIIFCLTRYFTENSLPSAGLPSKIIKFMSKASVNFFLVQLYGSLDDIVFFSILEVKSMSLKSSLANLSFALTLLFLIFVCAILGFQTFILLGFRSLRSQALKTHNTELLERFQKKYEPVKILFDDFEESSLLQQGFLALLTARNLVFSIALTTLYEYPLTQTILFFILSLFILAFLILGKPFKEFIGAASQYFCEGVLIVVQLNTLIMAMMDSGGVDGEDIRNRLGDGIFVVNIILNIGGMIFLLVETLEGIFEYFLARYLRLNKEKIIELLLKWKKQEGGGSNEEIGLLNQGVTRSENIELNRSIGRGRRIVNIRDVDINRKKEDIGGNFVEENSVLEPMNTSGIIQENQQRRNLIKKPRIVRPSNNSRMNGVGPVNNGLEIIQRNQRVEQRDNNFRGGQQRGENNDDIGYYP